jgi:ABC-type sugar transport system ATPase subunit
MSGGNIVALTEPSELYARPPSLFAARFIGSPQINVWAIDGPDADLARAVAGNALPAARNGLLVGVRPEHFTAGNGPISGKVTLTEQLGRDYLVHLEAGPSQIRALIPAGEAGSLNPGDSLSLRVDPANLHLFDAESGQRVAAA